MCPACYVLKHPNSPYSAVSPGEKLDYKACEALEEIFKRVQFKIVDLEQTSLDEDVSCHDLSQFLVTVSQLTQTSRVLWSVLSSSWALIYFFGGCTVLPYPFPSYPCSYLALLVQRLLLRKEEVDHSLHSLGGREAPRRFKCVF